MGTHGEAQSLLATFRRWRRYRRFLADLMSDEPKPVPRARRITLEVQARAAARRVEDSHE